jgi:pimeloyl-ACP methyl ester carboxylesterase
VLTVGGGISTLGPVMGEMMTEVADQVRSVRVPGTAHFIAEENPAALNAELSDFFGSSALSST